MLLATERGMDILSEKPIADTWEACRDIYGAVTRAGVKMQVVQNYRYYRPMLTLRDVLRRGDLGESTTSSPASPATIASTARGARFSGTRSAIAC